MAYKHMLALLLLTASPLVQANTAQQVVSQPASPSSATGKSPQTLPAVQPHWQSLHLAASLGASIPLIALFILTLPLKLEDLPKRKKNTPEQLRIELVIMAAITLLCVNLTLTFYRFYLASRPAKGK